MMATLSLGLTRLLPAAAGYPLQSTSSGLELDPYGDSLINVSQNVLQELMMADDCDNVECQAF